MSDIRKTLDEAVATRANEKGPSELAVKQVSNETVMNCKRLAAISSEAQQIVNKMKFIT